MYQHAVQYYETDKMGITHHSNYVRWMEEARLQFLAECGFNYAKLEEDGIISPVVAVECKYKKTTTYPDVVAIQVSVSEFKGVKLKISYRMTNQNGDVVCEAASEHCFLNQKGTPIHLKKEFPDFYETLLRLVEN